MSETPIEDRLNNLANWLDCKAQESEDISFHYNAEDVREVLQRIAQLEVLLQDIVDETAHLSAYPQGLTNRIVAALSTTEER